MTKAANKIWYIALPAYQYNENIQELAAAAGLRIIDASVTDDRTDAAPDKDLPVVTLREEFTPEHLAALAAIVPADKMESAILDRVRAEFRAMPYERQHAAYLASQQTEEKDAKDQGSTEQGEILNDALNTDQLSALGTDQLGDITTAQVDAISTDDLPALSTENIPAIAPAEAPAKAAPRPRKKKGR